MSNLLVKWAMRNIEKKAIKLHREGKTVDEIVEIYWAKDDVVKGLGALGIDKIGLRIILEEAVK